MRVLDVASCCVATQVVDFPNAHHEGPKSDKDVVLELLRIMHHNEHCYLFALVNVRQNTQMEKIFKFLGWTKTKSSARVTMYVHHNPYEFLKTHGLCGLNEYGRLFSPEFLERMSLPLKARYETSNKKSQRDREVAIQARKRFLRRLSKFKITYKDIASPSCLILELDVT